MPAKGTGKLKDLIYDILYQLHYVEDMSLTKIAKLYNSDRSSISDYAKKINLPAKKTYKPADLSSLTYEIFYNLYWVENKSLNYISKIYNVGNKAIKRKAEKFGILLKGKKCITISCDELHNMHYIENMSLVKIAKKLGVSQTAVSKHAKKIGFKPREMNEAAILSNSGENSHTKSPEYRAKMSGVHGSFYGRTHTKEARTKISLKNKEFNLKNGNPRRSKTPKFGTILNKSIRHLSKYHEWRTACYIRDYRTCQSCKETKRELNVDHIKPMFIILKENNIQTLDDALACDELWDINNGRVLCKKCHEGTDTYGSKAKNYIQNS